MAMKLTRRIPIMSNISALLVGMSLHISTAFLLPQNPCIRAVTTERWLTRPDSSMSKMLQRPQVVCRTTADNRVQSSLVKSRTKPPVVSFLISMLKLPNLLLLYLTGFSMLFVQNAYALSLSLHPISLSFSLQMKELLGLIFRNEMIFIVLTTAYFISVCSRYKNYASWRLPNPLPEAAETWISVMLSLGILMPMIFFVISPFFGLASSTVLAVFAPYFLGIVEQLISWRLVGYSGSPVWPLVPLPFTLWRLVQIYQGAEILRILNSALVYEVFLRWILFPTWVVTLTMHVRIISFLVLFLIHIFEFAFLFSLLSHPRSQIFLWPTLYYWARKDETFLSPVGPAPTKVDSKDDADDDGVIEELKELQMQVGRLRLRAEMLRKLQTNSPVTENVTGNQADAQ
eukprot:762781-Hanusia_phi.AAC.22